MEIEVRFGTEGDLAQAVSFDKYLMNDQLSWKLRNNEIIMAGKDGEVVGYMRVEFLWSKFPYIGLIIVQRDHQKQGIGKKMLEFLETNLKERGIYRLYSSSQVNEAESQAWHRHMGFVECGIINGINEGNIGEVFFVKDLKEVQGFADYKDYD